MFKRLTTLFPLILGFTILVQSEVAVDHVHLNDVSEQDCQICTGGSDLAPESELLIAQDFEPEPFACPAAVAIARAALITQQSRGPPALN